MFSLGEAIYIEGTIDENGLITIPTHQFFANDSKYGEITIEISNLSHSPTATPARISSSTKTHSTSSVTTTAQSQPSMPTKIGWIANISCCATNMAR